MSEAAAKAFELFRGDVGNDEGTGEWFEVTQDQINQFADVTHDHQFIHVDPARAKDTPFGTTIAHGFLTLSLLTKFIESTFSFADRKMGVNYGLNRVRFTAPLPSNSRVRGRFKLAKYEKIEGNGVQVTWDVTVEREGSDKPVLVAEWIGRSYY